PRCAGPRRNTPPPCPGSRAGHVSDSAGRCCRPSVDLSREPGTLAALFEMLQSGPQFSKAGLQSATQEHGLVVLVGHRIGILHAPDFDERRANGFIIVPIAAHNDRRPRIALARSPEPVIVMTRSHGWKSPPSSHPPD